MYLLDTNTWIHYLNNTAPSVRQHLEGLHPNQVFLCEVIRFELLFGAEKSQRRDHNLKIIELLTAQFMMLPFNNKVSEYAAKIRHDLQRSGTPIGAYDLLIAATAMAHDATLVTNNVNEFSRVNGLRVEDWTV